CTTDHKIMIASSPGGTWKEAGDLKVGDMVFGSEFIDGKWVHGPRVIDEVSMTTSMDHNKWVYDLEVPEYHNFGVYAGDYQHDKIVYVHNCRSVHAEQNAIIAADRSKMLWAKMYIYQWDPINRCIRKHPGACQLCQRMIINAGIEQVIFADPDGMHYDKEMGFGIRCVNVQDWVENPPVGPIG
ncbi:MAG: hypothetical protein K2F99_07740, partial [Muribaculaceae bacterium]|nr:hypothetical protein [Muribaculaceae bacterium]